MLNILCFNLPESQGGGIRSEVLVQAGGQENQYDMYTRWENCF